MAEIEDSIIHAAISEDEKLKEHIRRLAWKVVRQSEYLLENGNTSIQVQTIKNIMPAITNALKQQADDEKYNQLRRDFESQMQEMRKSMGLDFDIPVDNDE